MSGLKRVPRICSSRSTVGRYIVRFWVDLIDQAFLVLDERVEFEDVCSCGVVELGDELAIEARLHLDLTGEVELFR